MNLRFRSKIVILFALLSMIFIVIQGCLLAFLKTSWFLSSLIGAFASILLAYFSSKILIEPISKITEMVTRMGLGLPTRHIFPEDELSNLLKAIDRTASQLRRNIEEISQEKEYLQAILKGMAEGVLVVDPRDRVRMINEALRNLLSLPANGTDKSPLEIIRNAQLESSIHAAIQDGKSSAFEMDATFASSKTFEVNVVPIHGNPDRTESDQRVSGVIAVFHDITRLKELEKIRQDFVANVSHELRTPLTTIKGYAETLLEGALKEDVALQFLQIIKKNTDRLTKLVEDLLTLSKVESKEFQLKLEPFSIQELIEDAFGFRETPWGRNTLGT